MDMKSMRRIAVWVNTSLIVGIFTGLISFRLNGVTYMVWHCIPTLAALIGLYGLLYKSLLYQYAVAVYAVLTAYMIAGTICMGYGAGFILYCMSLTPLTFYMEYMAYKLGVKHMKALPVSLGFTVTFLAVSGYVLTYGPVYPVTNEATLGFMCANALIVFGFLIGYAAMMFKTFMSTEGKLTDMAHRDYLTGLFNRHYMTSHIEQRRQSIRPGRWIAMADIDDFKKINDTYGHGCGDYVLIEMARIMGQECRSCTISRWGGEEFLIIGDDENIKPQIMEQLRRTVAGTPFAYEGTRIKVTITIGVAFYEEDQSLSQWIQRADDKLYEGKHGDKNRVVC